MRLKFRKSSDSNKTARFLFPLNSNVASAFAKFKVRLIGQDGSVTLKSLSTSNGFTLVDGASVDTKTLGIHTLRVKYAADDVLGGVIEIPIVYFVVLEADASLFEYEIADTQTVELGGETFAGKVRIVSCKASSAETIVLPSIWTAANGDKYIVSEIGKTIRLRVYSKTSKTSKPCISERISTR